MNPTSLETARLRFRPLNQEDAPVLTRLAGRREIADTTISIPHPYSEAQAREWLKQLAETEGTRREIIFAITLLTDGRLVGTVGLREIDQEHAQAEMGFWIAVDEWRKGYATEAALAMLRFGFDHLQLNRIYAHHMVRNPASGRVLEKAGMKREGRLRERVRKWGVFEDVVLLSILRKEWGENRR